MAETPLYKKLKIKEGNTLLVINAPDQYSDHLSDLPERVGIHYYPDAEGKFDVVHLFVTNKASLDELVLTGLNLMKPEGVLWISYPKKSSKIPTDLSRDEGWESMLKMPLQWLSLISFNEQWSAFAVRNDTGKPKPVKKIEGVDVNGISYIDKENRVVTTPTDLQLAFKQNKIAEAFYNTLPFTCKKEYVCWIVDAKQDATREKRVKATVEKLENKKKNPGEK